MPTDAATATPNATAEPSLEDLIAEASKPAIEKTTEETPPDESTDETPPAAEATTDTDDTEEESPAEAEGADFIAFCRDEFGEDLSKKYSDPREAVKGLVEAYRAVGRRDEDASYGKAIRQLLQGRESELSSFLAGHSEKETQKPAKGAKREIEDFPEDADEWASQIEEKDGKYAPREGATFTMADYLAFTAAQKRRMNQLFRDYPKLKELPNKVQEELGRDREAAAATKEQQAIREIQNQYLGALFVNGDEHGSLTPIGQRVDAEFRELCADSPNDYGKSPSKALRKAIKTVLGDVKQQTKPPPVKPGAKAVRTPGVAPETSGTYRNTEDEISQRISKGEDMVKVLTEVHSRLQKGKLG